MNHFNRRHFIQSGAAVSTLLNLELANFAAAENAGVGDDRKSLVCVFFGGGLDSYHTLVPRDNNRYSDYKSSRTNIAHDQDDLLPLYEEGRSEINETGELYGLHPSCQELAEMFNGKGDFEGNRSASWVSNVGTLIKPLTLEEYRNGTPGFDVPVGVGGHVRQVEQWQTALPQGTVNLKGWLGRAADLMQASYNRTGSSMNLSLAGNNTLQLGDSARPLSYKPGSPLGLTGTDVTDPNNPLAIKNLIHRRILSHQYDNFVEKTFADISTTSLERQLQIKGVVEDFDKSRFIVPFPSSAFGRNLEAAAILIATREDQGLCRQTFFVPATGGWDDHFELGRGFDERIRSVSQGIAIFQRNIDHLGLRDSVLGFTASEFARTLRSTSNGSDHAWGGPQMIFGGPIEPGKVFDRFPSLVLDGQDDTGRGGRILPSRSCDEYFADMLTWFGLDNNMLDLVLPNYSNFRIPGRDPIGYLST